jgi:hypothetical protein
MHGSASWLRPDCWPQQAGAGARPGGGALGHSAGARPGASSPRCSGRRRDAPWLRVGPTARVAADADQACSRRPGTDAAGGLPAAYLERVKRTQVRIEPGLPRSCRTLLRLPTPSPRPCSGAEFQCLAGRPDHRRTVASIHQHRPGRADPGPGPPLLSSGAITFSGDVGQVPVTIANDSDQTVTVGPGPAGRGQVPPRLALGSRPGHRRRTWPQGQPGRLRRSGRGQRPTSGAGAVAARSRG